MFLKYHIHYNISKTLNFSSLLFYFSIFMEETYNIPWIVRNNQVYRTSTILWLLTAIVLTNSYVSHVISGLNAPLMGQKVEKIETLYVNVSKRSEDKYTPILENLNKFYKWLFTLLRNPSLFFTTNLTSFLEEHYLTKSWKSIGYNILSEPSKLPYPKDVWLHIRNPFIYKLFYSSLIQI